MSDRTEKLENAADSPKSASGDGQSASAHSLPDQIAMDNHLAEKKRAKSRKQPLKLFSLSPPGGTGV